MSGRQLAIPNSTTKMQPATGTQLTDPDDATLGRNAQDTVVYSIKTNLIDFKWDYVKQTQTATTDTWTFKLGGSGGTTVGVIVITYTDSSKDTIDAVERTA